MVGEARGSPIGCQGAGNEWGMFQCWAGGGGWSFGTSLGFRGTPWQRVESVEGSRISQRLQERLMSSQGLGWGGIPDLEARLGLWLALSSGGGGMRRAGGWPIAPSSVLSSPPGAVPHLPWAPLDLRSGGRPPTPAGPARAPIHGSSLRGREVGEASPVADATGLHGNRCARARALALGGRRGGARGGPAHLRVT